LERVHGSFGSLEGLACATATANSPGLGARSVSNGDLCSLRERAMLLATSASLERLDRSVEPASRPAFQRSVSRKKILGAVLEEHETVSPQPDLARVHNRVRRTGRVVLRSRSDLVEELWRQTVEDLERTSQDRDDSAAGCDINVGILNREISAPTKEDSADVGLTMTVTNESNENEDSSEADFFDANDVSGLFVSRLSALNKVQQQVEPKTGYRVRLLH
jgi:hypothetical protein